MSGRILVVDDDAAMCDLLAVGLGKRGFTVTTCTDPAAASGLLAEDDYDVVVTDLNMRGLDGLSLCARINASHPEIAVVVITAFGSMDAAIQAIRAGAYDFIPKPIELDALRLTLERAVRHRELSAEVRRLRRAVADARGLDEMIGDSAAMRAVYDLVARVADTDASVLITGDSGTGKELVARAIHRRSRRADGPFVAINCAAMPEHLLESELFGHVKGAFTDARTTRAGLFVQASGGTLFLDEIGELPLGLQPKLLRALQERKVRPVGADAEVPFDARIVAATNVDLEAAVEDKRFRDDLYYRINVVHVGLPPLRARGGDILALAQHFVRRFAKQFDKPVTGITTAAAEKLAIYAWPGNVRELANCIERAVALTRYEQLTVDDLPEKIRDFRTQSIVVVADHPGELVPIAEIERRYILRVLEAHGGSRTLAAQTLGLDRKTLYRKLKSYGEGD
ncbi:MAG: sigma-54-dependent Fis family transcriptional regulator [Kofleriaceae bacterium]|nr:sigma-54-dependent Fis family transcriptional regulator [Myxococcales bacterium]MCB9574652.1 sigma-54-dependent Fis family transcriptional regulator [Kofleriaceae bacterium]